MVAKSPENSGNDEAVSLDLETRLTLRRFVAGTPMSFSSRGSETTNSRLCWSSDPVIMSIMSVVWGIQFRQRAFNCVFDLVEDFGTKASARDARANAIKKIVVLVENVFIVVRLRMEFWNIETGL